jgi:hypothetical protein
LPFGYQRLQGPKSPHDQAVGFLEHLASVTPSAPPGDTARPGSLDCSQAAITPQFPNPQMEQQIGYGLRLVTCSWVTEAGVRRTECIGVGSKIARGSAMEMPGRCTPETLDRSLTGAGS